MGKFLYFLSNSPHCRAALLLLSEDGHHGLSKQVCVLTMTHHLLLETHTKMRSDYKDAIINIYSGLKKKKRVCNAHSEFRQIFLQVLFSSIQ